MTQLIRSGGDSLGRHNNFGGLYNPFHFEAQNINNFLLLNKFSCGNVSTKNEWKRNEPFPLISSGFPPWQTLLPLSRFQQLSLETKVPPVEDWRTLQGLNPALFPVFRPPPRSLTSSAKQTVLKHQAAGNNHTSQSFVQFEEVQSDVQKVSKSSASKPDGRNKTESGQRLPGTPCTPDGLHVVRNCSNEGRSCHSSVSFREEIDLLTTRKRSSSWPSDNQINKKQFLENSRDDGFCLGYKNLEMDVANILVSDIPIAVVGSLASKDDSVQPKKNSEELSHSSDSAVDVDSDGSIQLEREKCSKNFGRKPRAVVFTCQQCAITFESTEDLISHTSNHTTTNFTFTCNVCSQVFRSTSGLQKHVEFHTDDDHRYHCSFCFQLFFNKNDLEEHIINAHMSRRPHKCTYCPKAFRDPGSLQKHIRVHTGEKPYQCKACDKSFAEYSSLRKHFRVHTGEQPYKCKFCPKAFSISGNLQRHILIHTGERPYRCSECSKAFNNPSHLRRHIKNLHSKLESQK